MRNTLFIASLYLILCACGEKSNEVKFISESNPIVTDKFTADPADTASGKKMTRPSYL